MKFNIITTAIDAMNDRTSLITSADKFLPLLLKKTIQSSFSVKNTHTAPKALPPALKIDSTQLSPIILPKMSIDRLYTWWKKRTATIYWGVFKKHQEYDNE